MLILRICLIFGFFSFCTGLSHSAITYGYLVIDGDASKYGSASISLEYGEVLEPTATGGEVSLSVRPPNSSSAKLIMTAAPSHGNFHYGLPVLSGPCTITISGAGGSLMSYKITRPDPAVISNVVTLPHTSGNWEVQLETSSDLKNWTAVAPGSFSGNPDLQFFRVKATQIQSP